MALKVGDRVLFRMLEEDRASAQDLGPAGRVWIYRTGHAYIVVEPKNSDGEVKLQEEFGLDYFWAPPHYLSLINRPHIVSDPKENPDAQDDR